MIYTFSTMFRDGVWLIIALSLASLTLLSGTEMPLVSIPAEAAIPAATVLGASLVSLAVSGGRKETNNNVLLQTLVILCIASGALLLLQSWGLLLSDSTGSVTYGVSRGTPERLQDNILVIFGSFALLRCGFAVCTDFWNCFPFLAPRILIVGNGKLLEEASTITRKSRGRYRLSGAVDCASQVFSAHDAVHSCACSTGLLEFARSKGVKRVVVAFSERRGNFPVDEILRCRMHGILVQDIASFYEDVTKKLFIENITPSWFIFSPGFRVSSTKRFMKRALDLSCAAFGLMLTLPFFPLIALAIKLDSPGPVFFRQIRLGEGDREFSIIKFRTMRADAEKGTGAVWAKQNDNRITRLGNFLRKSRIDEIPQLINVLEGTMSMVGPRPERPEFVTDLKKQIPFYSERHYVKPGVTGWAQVLYPYGASVEDAVEKLRYDLFYIKNYSVFLDINIILKTVGVVLFRKGGR